MIQFDTDNITIVDGIGLLMPFPRGSNFEVKKGVTYTISVKQKRGKRSLSANGYAWVLMQRIAEELSKNGLYTSRNEVYKKAIVDCQAFQYVAVQTEHTEAFIKKWQAKGLGWVAIDCGPCKNFDGHTIQIFHGSSSYNSKEMARLIDCLVDECHQLGIETKPQDEIDNLLNEWSPNE